jgi:hypothetical protein
MPAAAGWADKLAGEGTPPGTSVRRGWDGGLLHLLHVPCLTYTNPKVKGNPTRWLYREN